MKHLNDKIISLNTFKANRLALKCTSYAEGLAEQFQLSHGGSLSIFRASTTSLSSARRAALIVMGYKTKRGFKPDPPQDRLQKTLSTGHYQDVCDNLYFVGIVKNNAVYFSIYRNDGDSPEDVFAFLWAMNRFIVSNDYSAA